MDFQYICDKLAISTGCLVRVYKDREIKAEHSVQFLTCDPIAPYLGEIYSSDKKVGIITNSIFQHIGYMYINKTSVLTFGPTMPIVTDETKVVGELMSIGVKQDQFSSYKEYMFSLPSYSLVEIANRLALFSYIIFNEKIVIETIFDDKNNIIADFDLEQTNQLFKNSYDIDKINDVTYAYNYEKSMLSMIRFGQLDRIKEVLSMYPSIKAGKMAKDSINQQKNIFVCSATLASRSAIEGGMDCVTALQASDFFIQRLEILTSEVTIGHLLVEMFTFYAEKVNIINVGALEHPPLIRKAMQYVSKRIGEPIKVYEMAIELKVNKAYLSAVFNKECGVMLTEYIAKQKIQEAKRLLIYSDNSLVDIANYLSFSSQSHFQNVFKRYVGTTPNKYRLDKTTIV